MQGTMTPDNPFAPSNTAPHEFDANELRAPGTVCFRLRKDYWIAALICAGIFASCGAYALVLPYIDPTESILKDDIRPAMAHIFFAILSLTTIAWLLRVKLWLTSQSIVFRYLFTHAIPYTDVNRIVWCINRYGAGACIEVCGPVRRIVLRVESFEWKDQNVIVAAIRRSFPMDIQSGWNEAFEMRLDYAERG